MIDSYSEDKFGGSGNSADWESFSNYQKKYSDKKWVLAGGIGPQNVVQAIQMTSPSIIDLNSKVESKPGIKDETEIETVFKFISDL